MKAILISIKPKYVAKILNGEKTIEIRKTMPKCDLPIDVYIYCTKDKELLHRNCVNIYWVEDKDFKVKNKKLGLETQPYLNGKVVAKFTLNKIEEIRPNDTELLKQSCLTKDELINYLCVPKIIILKTGYAWHISNLEIFNKPKELYEFHKPLGSYDCNHNCGGGCDMCWCEGRETRFHFECEIQKAPQSFCYIEVEK